jgi:Tol biopolymer transport system component
MSRLFALLFAFLVLLMPLLAPAQTVGDPLVGTSVVINDAAGDQTDPHASGTRVVYTNQPSRGVSEVRYRDLSTGAEQAIATQGAYDSQAELQGRQIVFTRTTTTNFVYRFDVLAGGHATEVAPRPDVDRRTPALGGHSVAWQEQGYTARGAAAELFVFNQDTQALTRLTTDTSVDRTPAVSPDGATIVWSKCATSTDGCDIWAASESGTGYTVAQLSGSEGEDSAPDTNGEVVVYVSRTLVNGVAESDIVWKRLDGGERHRLALPGTDANPSISGPLIAFEHFDTTSATPNYDVLVYDLRTDLLYRLTQTPLNESLGEVNVGEDGLVRVVWSSRDNGDANVRGYVFRLPTACTQSAPWQSAEAVCASPGTRQLIGLLNTQSSAGMTGTVSAEIFGQGSAVLCVDNGYQGERATSGSVWLGNGLAVDPSEFGEDVAGLARSLPLQGRRVLSAQAGGSPGGSFRARLYGPLSCDVAAQDATFEGSEVLYGRSTVTQAPEAEAAVDSADSAGSARYTVLAGEEGLPPRR